MSVFASDLLEEIVEATEEQEADLCSSGETVDECTGLPLGSEFIEEPERKHQPLGIVLESASPTTPPTTTTTSSSSSSRPHKSSRSSSQNVSLNGNANPGRGASSRNHMEQEKRMRREIANSNERRRMQSINAGFQSLRTLLPHHEGEKLSK
ncbi:oligodendrocyte transcription factor 1-like, partial [Phymastichus coffea]|uniref:oligodendrocyte transcription factor 1-like n=1 Tax=Phymastichus coffea TaxID=108790 RepID=UPI00273B52D2